MRPPVEMPPCPTTEAPLIEAGTPDFRRTSLAMFAGGFATFALLYATQPILPGLSAEFGVGATRASLLVSAGTASLAAMLIPASVLADRFGRQTVMKIALVLAAAIGLLSAFATGFDQLLVLRLLLGAVIAGLPAAAMAYLGEEVAPNAQGRAIGLYIAGNALGGMSGRFLVAGITDFASWRIALAVLGLVGVLAAVVFWRYLPASRHFKPRTMRPARIAGDARVLFGDAGLRWLFLIAFLIMGAFASLYNYLGFRLHEPPFSLGQTAIGAVFLLYLVGTFSSAWTGRLIDRIGRRRVLGTMLAICTAGLFVTLSETLIVVILGVAVFTFGYFGVHTSASGWVGRRAGERRALASALYLCSFYVGSSVVGTLSGLAWEHVGWPGMIGALAALLGVALLAARGLGRIAPVAAPPLARQHVSS